MIGKLISEAFQTFSGWFRHDSASTHNSTSIHRSTLAHTGFFQLATRRNITSQHKWPRQHNANTFFFLQITDFAISFSIATRIRREAPHIILTNRNPACRDNYRKRSPALTKPHQNHSLFLKTSTRLIREKELTTHTHEDIPTSNVDSLLSSINRAPLEKIDVNAVLPCCGKNYALTIRPNHHTRWAPEQ